MFGFIYGKLLTTHVLVAKIVSLCYGEISWVLEIFHPVLLAKMSQLSPIKKTQGCSDKQPGVNLPCRKQCKYNSTLKTQPSLTITHQGEEQSAYRWHHLLFDLEHLSWKVPAQVNLWLVGASDSGSEVHFYGTWWVLLQLATDSSWVIDPRSSHANASTDLSGVPKRDGSVLLRRQTQNHWM